MFSNYFDLERFIHSAKIAIACLIGYLVTRLIGSKADPWIVITIIVVMCAQIYVGSVVQKGLLRFIGTLVGCLFATATILLIGVTPITAALTIALASFVFGYLATSTETLTYAGTLGAVTTAIILLNPHPTPEIALLRFLEISLGVLIATLTSQFVLPIHARSHLRKTQAKTMLQLGEYYKACMITLSADRDEMFYQEFDESIAKLLSKQRQLAKEAAREPLGIFFDAKLFVQSLQSEKEILRAIDFMHHALAQIHHHNPEFKSSQALQDFNLSMIAMFNDLVKIVLADQPVKLPIHIPSIQPLTVEMQQLAKNHPGKTMLYIDGLLFCTEVLVTELQKLLRLMMMRSRSNGTGTRDIPIAT